MGRPIHKSPLKALTTFSSLVAEAHALVVSDTGDQDYANAVATYLAFGVDKMADTNSQICTWQRPLPDCAQPLVVKQFQ